MAEPVNLNKARKARKRVQDKARADANSVRFGRTKGQKAAEETRKAQESARLDGHHRDKP